MQTIRPQVLLVDDEPEVISAIKEALFQETYDIVGLTDPLEALRLIQAKTFDVVVADEKMPNMSGTELLAIVKRDCPSAIRIILTGHASVGSAVRAINEGAVYRYLLKPFPALELGETIRQGLIDKQEAQLRERIVDGALRQHDAIADYAAGNVDLADQHWQRALALYTDLDLPDAERIRARLHNLDHPQPVP